VQDDFNVGIGPEAMSGRLQLTAQIRAVVDFAVADEVDITGLVADRLIATRQIDDAQAAEAQSDSLGAHSAMIIRPPVGQSFGHPAGE
jgi:hypothetical protein